MAAERSFITAAHRPEESVLTALMAASRGRGFDRSLTAPERSCIALLALDPPTHVLTLHGPGLSRDALGLKWEQLRKRLGRQRGKEPLYFGCIVRASASSGWHLHVLLWEYIHAASLHGHAAALGLGKPCIKQVPAFKKDPIGAMTMVSYVLGQQTPVFGNTAHRRHAAREKGDHRFIKPKLTTFAARRPDISAALKLAEDEAVSDLALFQRLPKFSDAYRTGLDERLKSPSRHAQRPSRFQPMGNLPRTRFLRAWGSRLLGLLLPESAKFSKCRLTLAERLERPFGDLRCPGAKVVSHPHVVHELSFDGEPLGGVQAVAAPGTVVGEVVEKLVVSLGEVAAAALATALGRRGQIVFGGHEWNVGCNKFGVKLDHASCQRGLTTLRWKEKGAPPSTPRPLAAVDAALN